MFTLGAMTLVIVSLIGPACESACGDSAPESGSSCSGTLVCGDMCGENWECKGGKWSVWINDCFFPGRGDASEDAAQDGDGDVDSDASADAACDAPADHAPRSCPN